MKACVKHGFCNLMGMEAIIRGGSIIERKGSTTVIRGAAVLLDNRGRVIQRVHIRMVRSFTLPRSTLENFSDCALRCLQAPMYVIHRRPRPIWLQSPSSAMIARSPWEFTRRR